MADLERRKLLRALLRTPAQAAATVVEDRLSRRFPLERRPPGAQPEATFLSLCTKCGECSNACPYGSVYVYDAEAGASAGTPVMVPDERPCLMCEGFPCAAACEPRALVVPTETVWPLGSVSVREDLCFTFRGPECGACGGLCPPGAQALSFRRNQPQIDLEQCMGCGRCIDACPTMPKAIELHPLGPA
ncbi:MAG: 4Fe-4S dicluster domain-containing protein [Myxococcales bacterium]|nr:4Fe-4S dicluster domain-containing protein [Myxococcales bacterium]